MTVPRVLAIVVALCLVIASVLLAWVLTLILGYWIMPPGLSLLYAWYVGGRLGAAGAYHPLLLWSAVYVACVGLAVLLVVFEWPMDMGGYDAHGFGASGGESNFTLLPIWLVPAMYHLMRRYVPSHSMKPSRPPRGLAQGDP